MVGLGQIFAVFAVSHASRRTAIVSNSSFSQENSFRARAVLPHRHALLLEAVEMATKVKTMNYGASR
jgi:hypothetical protein